MINESNFKQSLDMTSFVIIANMNLENKVNDTKEEDYIYLENPIKRINEINY